MSEKIINNNGKEAVIGSESPEKNQVCENCLEKVEGNIDLCESCFEIEAELEAENV